MMPKEQFLVSLQTKQANSGHGAITQELKSMTDKYGQSEKRVSELEAEKVRGISTILVIILVSVMLTFL